MAGVEPDQAGDDSLREIGDRLAALFAVERAIWHGAHRASAAGGVWLEFEREISGQFTAEVRRSRRRATVSARIGTSLGLVTSHSQLPGVDAPSHPCWLTTMRTEGILNEACDDGVSDTTIDAGLTRRQLPPQSTFTITR